MRIPSWKFIVFACGLLASSSDAAGADCLSYSTPVQLEGVLERLHTPGFPALAGTGKSRSDTTFILRLSKPVCLYEDVQNAQNFANPRITAVEARFVESDFKTALLREGRTVMLWGELIPGNSVTSRLPVLLMKSSFRKSNVN